MRERIMSTGVTRSSTRFIGRRCDRYSACEAVRGKPSRMKDVLGSVEGLTAAEADPLPRPRAATISSFDLDVDTHFRDLSSERMRLRIKGSGTRPPSRIYVSALMPKYGVSAAASYHEIQLREWRSGMKWQKINYSQVSSSLSARVTCPRAIHGAPSSCP